MQQRRTTHLWLAGAGLLAAWLLVFVLAASVLGSCGSDCGDNGGRGALVGLVAIAVMVHGVGSVIHLFVGHDTVDHAATKDAFASLVIAFVLSPIAGSGLLPFLAGRNGDTARRARWVAGALALVYFLLTVLSLGNPDLLPYLVVGVVTTAAAALTFAELDRRKTY